MSAAADLRANLATAARGSRRKVEAERAAGKPDAEIEAERRRALAAADAVSPMVGALTRVYLAPPPEADA